MSLSCQAFSEASPESLLGTAIENVQHVLVVEYTKPWASKMDIAHMEFSPHCAEALQYFSKKTGWKVLFVRQPKQTQQRILYSNLQNNTVWESTYTRDDIWNLESLENWTRVEYPVILVCTHGTRDKCCGTLGGALFHELFTKAEQKGLHKNSVWQVSHLGGHRFAPTMIALPMGCMLGRVNIEDIDTILSSVHQKDIAQKDIAKISAKMLRGDIRLSKSEQILQRYLLDKGITTWRPLASSLFQYTIDDVVHTVEIRFKPVGTLPMSCVDIGMEEKYSVVYQHEIHDHMDSLDTPSV